MKLISLLLTGLALSRISARAADRPNIVFILADLDVTALTEKVVADLDIARNGKPVTLKDHGKRAGTKRGFRK